MESIFLQIAIIIIVAAVLTIAFRFLKQPPILAYILTGVLLGPLGLFHLQNHHELQMLGQLGITLLLFMLGLELKLRELRSIGKTAIIAGTAQMALTFALSFGVSVLLGFSSTIALYLAIALSFSSTIVIVKLLDDKKDLNSLHGKLSLGILLMQDFFAVLTIIFFTGFAPGGGFEILLQVFLVLLKVIVLFGWMFVLGLYVFPKIVRKIAKSSESLFLFSLAWVFAVTAVVTSPFVGFSIEIGGFLAGLALAGTAENYQIVARMKALRDFFIIIFFVMLGLEMKITNLYEALVPALLLSLFVIVFKPILIMLVTSLMGFRKRTSFFVGVSLSQISEFSLIILFLGNQKGMISDDVVTIAILITMITFVTSTYMIQNTNFLYKKLNAMLSILEFRKKKTTLEKDEQGSFEHFKKHIIIIGAHQMGQSIIHALSSSQEQILVVDFDPDVVERLKQKNIAVMFGDIADTSIQEIAGFDRAKLVISTVPDLEDNLLLLEGLHHTNKKATVVVMALEPLDAKELYKAGADYVVMPHLAGGHHLAKMLISENHLEIIEKFKKKDLEYLK